MTFNYEHISFSKLIIYLSDTYDNIDFIICKVDYFTTDVSFLVDEYYSTMYFP